ncbi:MAG: DNA polymerase domain-containing protein [Halobacteria archaeon]
MSSQRSQSGLGTFDGGTREVEEPEDENEEDNTHLEIGLSKADYTVEDTQEGPKPIVHVFGRTAEGSLKHLKVENFRPYFYAPSHEVGGAEDERVLDTEEGYTGIGGTDLTRIYTRVPADVSEVRESYTYYEADILFPDRFKIDKDIKSGLKVPWEELEHEETEGRDTYIVDEEDVEPADISAPVRTMVADIEVEDRNGFPEDGEEPIICLTAWDSFEETYHVFAQDVEGGEDREYDYVLHEYEGEREMLDAFLDYLNDRDPGVLTGWNCDDFDYPYLIDRLEEIGMDANRLSRVGNAWHSGGRWGGPTIKGRSTFDLLYGYQRMKFTELESYRLDAIAEEELGESKVTYTGKIGDLWDDDTERLLYYNKVDVELCVEIDKKVGTIDFFRELARFVGCSLEDSTTPSDVVDIYVLRKAFGEFVLPSRGGGGGGDEYEGGEVFEPITGIRENVVVLDLASLYPMSMVTVNASPETKVGEEYDGEVYPVEVPGEGTVRFRKDREGLTKTIVTELLEERDKKKELRDSHEMGSEEYLKYDNQQNAIKVVMNCFSGDTEVVGPDGIRNIREVEVGDSLYTIDPETQEVEIKEVVETQEYGYSDEMVDIETRHTDFSVTPNHRMLVEVDGETRFVEAGDLNDYTNYQIPGAERIEGEKPDKFHLYRNVGNAKAYVSTEKHGTTFKHKLGGEGQMLECDANRTSHTCSVEVLRENPEILEEASSVVLQKDSKHSSVPAEYSMENWLRFVGWYVTEGSVYKIQPKEYVSTNRGRSQKIQFGQINDDGRSKIEDLLDEMGLNPSSETRQISICNGLLANWLTENCGTGSANKKLPEFVWSLDWRYLEVLFHTLIAGDGDRYSGIPYSTKSDELKDDVVRLAVHLGYKPMVNHDSGVWRIRFTDNEGTFRMQRNGGRSKNEEGKVYCVTVEDNHTVLAGRNGKFQWVGQSYYGVAGYSRFRLYDREMGSAVTATGRAVIEHTRDAVEKLGYDVIYGDTDSTLVELDPDMDTDEIIDVGLDLEEKVNDSYDEFAKEEFNADEHRWDIEFEKLYRRFFQAGQKKRYAGHLVWKEGSEVDEIDITGFEYKRSDVSQATKEIQSEVIETIIKGGEFEEVSEYLQDVVERFKDGEFGLEYAAIPGGIGQALDAYDNDTAHVKGARYANEHFGTNFASGSKPKRLYIKRTPDTDEYPATDVICFNYPEQVPDGFQVDWEKMLEKTIEKPISRILEALGWSWSEVVTGQRQQGLGSFM